MFGCKFISFAFVICDRIDCQLISYDYFGSNNTHEQRLWYFEAHGNLRFRHLKVSILMPCSEKQWSWYSCRNYLSTYSLTLGRLWWICLDSMSRLPKSRIVKFILFFKLDYVIDKYCLFIFCYQFARIYDVLKNYCREILIFVVVYFFKKPIMRIENSGFCKQRIIYESIVKTRSIQIAYRTIHSGTPRR